MVLNPKASHHFCEGVFMKNGKTDTVDAIPWRNTPGHHGSAEGLSQQKAVPVASRQQSF